MINQISTFEKLWKFRVYIRVGAIILSAILLVLGFALNLGKLTLPAVMIVWGINIIWCLESLKDRFIFFFFQITMYIFLIGRPVIQYFKGEQWFFYGKAELFFCMVSLWSTLVSMYLGAIIAERYIIAGSCSTSRIRIEQQRDIIKYLQVVSLMVFLLAFIIELVAGLERIRFSMNHSYEEYYVSFKTHIPYLLRVLEAFLPYGLCIFLSTNPKKKVAFSVLTLYVLSAIPNFIVGTRNPVILNLLFALTYYLIRDNMGDDKKWFGKIEKILVFVGTPVLTIIMFTYAYVRAGLKIPHIGLNVINGFIYQQGTTFNVLSLGYDSLSLLPAGKCYTLGGLIDYYMHGSLAQHLFGATDLGSGNSVIMGTVSNSFAHNMSYIMHPEYLNGQGWGSCYILEVFADFGYLGVVIYSILIGILMMSIIKLCKTHYIFYTMSLVVLMQLFFTPRSSALGFLNPIFEMPFIVCLVGCIAGAYILKFLKRKLDMLRSENGKYKN